MTLLKTLVIMKWIFTHSAITLTNGYVDVLFNSDAYSPPTLIKKYGYPMETYHIQTPDGFILELHRIPRGMKTQKVNSFPVLLLHGFIDSSSAWIVNGPRRSLAYLLADQVYDVWMLNFRGNTFSNKHINYTSDEPQFWDFSFDEMGIYDLPTAIDYILNQTNRRKLLCISQSAGNSVFHMLLSELPQYNDKIIAQVELAAFYHSETSPTRSLQANFFKFVAPILSEGEILGPYLQRDLQTTLGIQFTVAVQLFPDNYTLYDFMLYLAAGLRRDHINREIMPVVYNTFPAGTSLKTAQHMIQLFKSFGFFDYGPEENLKHYGTSFPPKYNISNIRIPVRLYHAKQDVLTNPEEVRMLYDQIPNKAGIVEISDLNYSHFDFNFNLNNNELVNKDVLDFANYVTKNS